VRGRNRIAWLAALACAAAMAGPATGATKGAIDLSELVDLPAPGRAGQEPNVTDLLLHLTQDPSDAGAHINLGYLYMREGKFDLAERAYHRAIRVDDDNPIVWNNLGVLYLRMGRVGEAESCFKEALDQDRRYALARYNLASIQNERGDYDSAVENFRIAIRQHPELGDVKHNPYIVTNPHLLTASLMNYLRRGNYSLLGEKSTQRLSQRVAGIAEPAPRRR
jgi:tetratricopeptide (TPR) repeat protein